MYSPPRPRPSLAIAAFLGLAVAAGDSLAIEMFTYFGDGSRIGLPSLEVPIEAYPGIPLRSDRLRARRRAARMGPGSTVRVGPGTPMGGVTIRAMPPLEAPAPRSTAKPAPEPATRTVPARPAARPASR